MSLTNPPPAVTALRDMLIACSSVTGAGIDTNKIFYPTAAAESDDTTTPTLPRMVLAEEDYAKVRYAEGARGIPQGRLACVIHSDVATGTLETLARSIIDDMEYLSHSTGLANLRGTAGLASEPTSGQRAADDGSDTYAEYASITITFEYGLNT